MPAPTSVLVTGASGFVALWCIAELLKRGYKVNGTVRSLTREPEIKKALSTAQVDQTRIGSNLQLFEADLLSDAGWKEVAKGCTYLLHLASPFPKASPKYEQELILPAVEGTKRALNFALKAGIKHVVLTSSEAAVIYGLPAQSMPFDERNWTDINARGVSIYQKSKTLAERAAWDWMVEHEHKGMTMATVNPSAVFGPAFSKDFGTSVGIIRNIAIGAMPWVPCVAINSVDVRDVADLHIRVMESTDSAGQRFCCTWGKPVYMEELVLEVKTYMQELEDPERMERIKHPSIVPNIILRLTGLFDADASSAPTMLGKTPQISVDNAKMRLGWSPRDNKASIRATVDSLIELGVI